MQVAIIGMGEVGRCCATALHAAGFKLSICDAMPSQAALAIASSSGLQIHTRPGMWLSTAAWVLSCVPGSQSLSVVEQVVAHLGKNAGIADFRTAGRDV
jgi:3-hydroxyisobutyrate dehydrogenase